MADEYSAGRIIQIEEALNELIRTVEAPPLSHGQQSLRYKDVSDVEVPPGDLPASTLLFSYPGQEPYATGGITENEWRWVQRSYFDQTDPAEAQREMKRLVPALLTVLRRNWSLTLADRTQLEISLEDGGRPEFGQARGYPPMLTKTLELVVRTEEN